LRRVVDGSPSSSSAVCASRGSGSKSLPVEEEAMGATMSPEQEELWSRIEKVRPAMMTTAEHDGSFRSRPMWTQGDAFDGSLWFFVAVHGPLAREVERDPRVGLSYAAPDKDLYVSVSGRATLVHDRAKADALWNTYAEAWFPGGVEDPNLGLLRVDVEQAQYWEDKKPKVLQFAEILVGAITNRPPKSGDEKKLDFQS
jgi:general stress protein 26